ncbi:hypothetical protein QM027_13465 [Campylobacter concisus]
MNIKRLNFSQEAWQAKRCRNDKCAMGKKINIMDDASESLLMNFFQKTFGTKRDPFWEI